ncbi:recombinase family protein [Pseudomonas shirazica]|uniref:recombinase family protein n=1 Tax=Pseudomonas shirazica TaxID=1940636 RepID=UPI00245342B5|nr:recombinase family protein [Pseudomonas shirazica]MDH4434029.1 recombinase family protein [Pseudomonas shirazica]
MPKIWPYIRFSSEEQRKGDSLRRQQSLIDSFAARPEIVAEGAVLDSSLDLNDLGVSGYTGKNILKGRFKTFLDAVDSGVVKRGDYLAVEAINRITRLDPMESLPIILDLLRKGIKIAITSSSQVYKYGDDITQIYVALGELQRAFTESNEKGRRVRDAWNAKKLRAFQTGEVATSRLPLWLKAVKVVVNGLAVREIEEIPERVEVVREIYRLSDNNVGAIATARILTERGVPTFTRENARKNPNYGDFWQPSYIKKILENRAVMGYYQPMTWEKLEDHRRRRIKQGQEVANYFPQIISPELFRRVQEKRKERGLAGQGNKGKKFSNLFTKLAHCSKCGATANHINKGADKRKGGKYLVCYRAKHGSCNYRAWPYEKIEKMLLKFLAEADIKSILAEKNKVDDLINLKYEIDSEVGEIQEMLENFKSDFKRLRGKVSDLERLMAIENEQRLEELSERKKAVESEIYKVLEQQKADVDKDIQSLQNLSNTEDDQTVFEIRSKINERLRLIIENIKIDFQDRAVEILFKSGVQRFLHEGGMYGNIPPKAEGLQRENDLAEIYGWQNLTDEEKAKKYQDAGFNIVPLPVGI